MTKHETKIRMAQNAYDFTVAHELILEYVAWLGMDLSFQDFNNEINNLPAMYSLPVGGLLLAEAGDDTVGIAGIRRFKERECELKRMFVKPNWRSLGIGRELVSGCIVLARELHYETIKLDTADFMVDAIKLYQQLGFVEIAPYRHNPHASAKFFELILKGA